MSKTLSNGVLSLRFMQNAQRAKQLKETELQRAEVADEGKWEVSQAVRAAWGLTRERDEDQETDVHEASYLPFLYSTPDDGGSEDRSSIATGRRVFKHTSLDVHDDNRQETQESDVRAASTSNTTSKPSKGRIHAHPRPISISSSTKGKATLLNGFDELNGSAQGDPDPKPTLRKSKGKETRTPKATARDLIFDSGNVGLDLRAQAQASKKETKTPAFLKPAGVDDPSSVAKGAQMVDGARRKSDKTKRNRDPDVIDDEEEEVQKKPKKKKNSDSRG